MFNSPEVEMRFCEDTFQAVVDKFDWSCADENDDEDEFDEGDKDDDDDDDVVVVVVVVDDDENCGGAEIPRELDETENVEDENSAERVD
jgi:hypothetical protein